MQEWRRSPGRGRYARPEVERRFIATVAAPVADSSWQIEDRYIDGTALRLRRITANGERVWKLTQKIRSDPGDPATVAITNMYLTRSEYDLLAALRAATLSKIRSVCVVDDIRFAIDVFDGELTGLRLAEVEVPDLAARLPRPVWLGREVTHDDRYSGGRLAASSASDLSTLLGGPG